MGKSQETTSNKTTTDTTPIDQGEDVEQEDIRLSPEDRIFRKQFHRIKSELEMAIRNQRALADDIDKTHKNLTQTSLVTNSLAVVSGTMNFLGLALAPLTAGGSLMLSAAGTGLGTVAGAASLVTSILEYRHNKQAQTQVSSELSALGQKAMDAGRKISNLGENVKNIRNNIRALQVARANPLLAEAAEQLLLTGEASARTTRKVQRAFKGTPLAMGSKAFLKNCALTGLFLGLDIQSLVNDLEHLKQGARTELVDSLRAAAEELERKLAEYTQRYERLQKILLQEESLGSSCAEETGATLPQPPTKQGKAGPWATGAAIAG